MKQLRLLYWFAAVYLGAWTVIYTCIMGSDFRYYFWYLALAWTGQAGEKPGLMHLVALACVFVFGILVVVSRILKKRSTVDAARN